MPPCIRIPFWEESGIGGMWSQEQPSSSLSGPEGWTSPRRPGQRGKGGPGGGAVSGEISGWNYEAPWSLRKESGSLSAIPPLLLAAVCPWASCLTALCPSVLRKMGMMVVLVLHTYLPHGIVMSSQSTQRKHLAPGTE